MPKVRNNPGEHSQAQNAEAKRIRDVYSSYQLDGSQSKWSLDNYGTLAILNERTAKLRELLARCGFLPLAQKRILDIGCGSGSSLSSLIELGAQQLNCSGVDLIPGRIADAKRNQPDGQFLVANAEALPYGRESFDLVVVFTVFSSILETASASRVASEASRVVRRGGGVLWYDLRFNNPRNTNVRGVSAKEIRRLFPQHAAILESVTLLPPLSRRLGRLTPVLYSCLRLLPCLRSHWLGVLVKP